MDDSYHPPSDFLRACIAEDVPLTGSAFADGNLRRLIEMTSDGDRANRDWAVLLLVQTDLDTPEVRAVLIERLEDEDEYVRGEALSGLAQRDRDTALPLVLAEIEGDRTTMQAMEAASFVAHSALLPALRSWVGKVDDEWFAAAVEDAIQSCETGTPPD